MKPSHLGTIIIGLCGLMNFSLFAADIDAGKSKSIVCAACHGTDGNSINAEWPKLAGQHATYMVKQLREFKSGVRANAIMQGMVASLSDQDMEDVSAYFESQAVKSSEFDSALVAKGEAIYRGGITETSVPACIACHSPSGDGNGPAKFPALKSQHADYLVSQLQGFKESARTNDPGKMMQNVAARMLDSEMQAVAAYLAGIQ